MTSAWTYETIAACLQKVRLPNAGKLQTRDYRSEGKYAIIDQGQGLIAGWTDIADGLIEDQLPVIVFGDHSRTLKYVDFPFVRGADGTQILKPRADIDVLYFYYACRSIDLSSRGYNRHFSLLKEQIIPVPAYREQVQIAAVLQRIERFVDLQSEQLTATRTLKRVALRELFSIGLRGRPLQEGDQGSFPDDWIQVEIGNLGRVVTGTTPPTKDPANYSDGTIPFITPGDFSHGDRVSSTVKKLSERGLAVSRPIPAGATCFVCIGSTIGKVGVATAPVSATNQQINAVIASERYEQRYIVHLLTYWSNYIQRHASPSPVPILAKGAFERIKIMTSGDPAEQREIADVLDAIDDRIAVLSRKAALGERLLTVLLRRLLNGEIGVGDVDLSSLPSDRGDAA